MTALLDRYHLIIMLAAKDLKVRYKSAFLGFLWALLLPAVLTIILSIIFTVLIPMGIDKFPVFLLCALFPWTFLSLSLGAGTTCIVDGGHLIKKVNFPRQALPMGLVASNLFNFLLSLLVLFVIAVIYKTPFSLSILAIPLLVVIQTIFVVGAVLFFAALHAYFRDVKYLVELLLLAWFYLTPIFYPLHIVSDRFSPGLYRLYVLNPMSTLVTCYRQIILEGRFPDMAFLGYTAAVSVVVFIIGRLVFKRLEPVFADIV